MSENGQANGNGQATTGAVPPPISKTPILNIAVVYDPNSGQMNFNTNIVGQVDMLKLLNLAMQVIIGQMKSVPKPPSSGILIAPGNLPGLRG